MYLILYIHATCIYSQLTAVKKGHPPTSNTWRYRRLKCPPIEVTCFFEVFCWQVTYSQINFSVKSPSPSLQKINVIWITPKALQVYCLIWMINYFINGSFAFSPDWSIFCSTYFSLDMTKEYTRCAHYNVWLLHQQRPWMEGNTF